MQPSHASCCSRCPSRGASAARRTVSRQRWTASAGRTAGAEEGGDGAPVGAAEGPSTRASLPPMEPPVPREHASGTSSPLPAEDRTAPAAPDGPESEPPPVPDTEARRPTGRRLGAPTPRAALTIGAALLVIVIMLAAFDAVRPFLLGAVLVYLMAPLVDRLQSVGIPRAVAVLLTFATVIFVIVAVVMLSLSPLIAQLQRFIRD